MMSFLYSLYKPFKTEFKISFYLKPNIPLAFLQHPTAGYGLIGVVVVCPPPLLGGSTWVEKRMMSTRTVTPTIPPITRHNVIFIF